MAGYAEVQGILAVFRQISPCIKLPQVLWGLVCKPLLAVSTGKVGLFYQAHFSPFSIRRELLLRWPFRNKWVTSRWPCRLWAAAMQRVAAQNAICCRRFDLDLGSRCNSGANFSQIYKTDFLLAASRCACGVLFLLRPHSTSPLVNLSTQDKADTWVKDSYLYHELYPIKSTCHPETLCS